MSEADAARMTVGRAVDTPSAKSAHRERKVWLRVAVEVRISGGYVNRVPTVFLDRVRRDEPAGKRGEKALRAASGARDLRFKHPDRLEEGEVSTPSG